MKRKHNEFEMKAYWYVVDVVGGALSWDYKSEGGERFSSEKAALKRAKILAGACPHQQFDVCKSIKRVSVGMKPVEVVSTP